MAQNKKSVVDKGEMPTEKYRASLLFCATESLRQTRRMLYAQKRKRKAEEG